VKGYLRSFDVIIIRKTPISVIVIAVRNFEVIGIAVCKTEYVSPTSLITKSLQENAIIKPIAAAIANLS